jgi:hypothetical protein
MGFKRDGESRPEMFGFDFCEGRQAMRASPFREEWIGGE